MNDEELTQIAVEIVRDYLDDGVEFLTVAEIAPEYAAMGSEVSDADLRRIHGLTRSVLTELAGNL